MEIPKNKKKLEKGKELSKRKKPTEIIMINGLKIILDFRCYPFV